MSPTSVIGNNAGIAYLQATSSPCISSTTSSSSASLSPSSPSLSSTVQAIASPQLPSLSTMTQSPPQHTNLSYHPTRNGLSSSSLISATAQPIPSPSDPHLPATPSGTSFPPSYLPAALTIQAFYRSHRVRTALIKGGFIYQREVNRVEPNAPLISHPLAPKRQNPLYTDQYTKVMLPSLTELDSHRTLCRFKIRQILTRLLVGSTSSPSDTPNMSLNPSSSSSSSSLSSSSSPSQHTLPVLTIEWLKALPPLNPPLYDAAIPHGDMPPSDTPLPMQSTTAPHLPSLATSTGSTSSRLMQRVRQSSGVTDHQLDLIFNSIHGHSLCLFAILCHGIHSELQVIIHELSSLSSTSTDSLMTSHPRLDRQSVPVTSLPSKHLLYQEAVRLLNDRLDSQTKNVLMRKLSGPHMNTDQLTRLCARSFPFQVSPLSGDGRHENTNGANQSCTTLPKPSAAPVTAFAPYKPTTEYMTIHGQDNEFKLISQPSIEALTSPIPSTLTSVATISSELTRGALYTSIEQLCETINKAYRLCIAVADVDGRLVRRLHSKLPDASRSTAVLPSVTTSSSSTSPIDTPHRRSGKLSPVLLVSRPVSLAILLRTLSRFLASHHCSFSHTPSDTSLHTSTRRSTLFGLSWTVSSFSESLRSLCMTGGIDGCGQGRGSLSTFPVAQLLSQILDMPKPSCESSSSSTPLLTSTAPNALTTERPGFLRLSLPKSYANPHIGTLFARLVDKAGSLSSSCLVQIYNHFCSHVFALCSNYWHFFDALLRVSREGPHPSALALELPTDESISHPPLDTPGSTTVITHPMHADSHLSLHVQGVDTSSNSCARISLQSLDPYAPPPHPTNAVSLIDLLVIDTVLRLPLPFPPGLRSPAVSSKLGPSTSTPGRFTLFSRFYASMVQSIQGYLNQHQSTSSIPLVDLSIFASKMQSFPTTITPLCAQLLSPEALGDIISIVSSAPSPTSITSDPLYIAAEDCDALTTVIHPVSSTTAPSQSHNSPCFLFRNDYITIATNLPLSFLLALLRLCRGRVQRCLGHLYDLASLKLPYVLNRPPYTPSQLLSSVADVDFRLQDAITSSVSLYLQSTKQKCLGPSHVSLASIEAFERFASPFHARLQLPGIINHVMAMCGSEVVSAVTSLEAAVLLTLSTQEKPNPTSPPPEVPPLLVTHNTVTNATPTGTNSLVPPPMSMTYPTVSALSASTATVSSTQSFLTLPPVSPGPIVLSSRYLPTSSSLTTPSTYTLYGPPAPPSHLTVITNNPAPPTSTIITLSSSSSVAGAGTHLVSGNTLSLYSHPMQSAAIMAQPSLLGIDLKGIIAASSVAAQARVQELRRRRSPTDGLKGGVGMEKQERRADHKFIMQVSQTTTKNRLSV